MIIEELSIICIIIKLKKCLSPSVISAIVVRNCAS